MMNGLSMHVSSKKDSSHFWERVLDGLDLFAGFYWQGCDRGVVALLKLLMLHAPYRMTAIKSIHRFIFTSTFQFCGFVVVKCFSRTEVISEKRNLFFSNEYNEGGGGKPCFLKVCLFKRPALEQPRAHKRRRRYTAHVCYICVSLWLAPWQHIILLEKKWLWRRKLLWKPANKFKVVHDPGFLFKTSWPITILTPYQVPILSKRYWSQFQFFWWLL